MAEKRKSPLERMESGEFIISVQIDPPGTLTQYLECKNTIKRLKRIGVNLVDINSSRRISHDSIQLAAAVSQMGLETIPHVTTRDSSINGLLNQVFAAYAWGNVQNFLIITGDPYETSQIITSTRGVFETDSIGAIRALDTHVRKNPKLALPIHLAAAVNQNEPDLQKEVGRLREKENAGADFFMSQPIFNEDQAKDLFHAYHQAATKPLLAGIWPLVGWRTIENIRSGRVVGVILPDEVYEKASEYAAHEAKLLQWGLEEAYQLIQFVQENKKAHGVYIVAPLRNPLLLAELLKKLTTKGEK